MNKEFCGAWPKRNMEWLAWCGGWMLYDSDLCVTRTPEDREYRERHLNVKLMV